MTEPHFNEYELSMLLKLSLCLIEEESRSV